MNRVLELLIKPFWSSDDIEEYIKSTGGKCGRDKATALRNEAYKKGGKIPYRAKVVSVETVLSLLGKNRIEEVKLIKLVEGE